MGKALGHLDSDLLSIQLEGIILIPPDAASEDLVRPTACVGTVHTAGAVPLPAENVNSGMQDEQHFLKWNYSLGLISDRQAA